MDIKKELSNILNDPDRQIEFMEKMHGEQLYPHQKLIIRLLIKNKGKGVCFNYPFRNGRTMTKKFMEKWEELFLKK